MAGRIIGRVAVKIIPDTTGFRSRAASDLKKIEKQLGDMKVDLNLQLSSKEKSQIKGEVEALEKSVDPTFKIDLDLNKKDVAAITGAMAALTKDRHINVGARMDVGSFAAVGAGIAAMSGLRYTTGLIQKFRDELLNLDKVVPTIGVVQHAIAGLGAWVLGVSGNLFSLSNSLASMGKAGLALPGILGGMAVGLGATAAALVDFNKEVPKASEYLKELQNTVSGNFWEKASEPIRSLVDELFPALNKYLASTGAALGKFFANMASSLENILVPNLGEMFEPLNESIKIASRYTDGFVATLTNLGIVGAAYLPALAKWAGDLSDRFGLFITRAHADGSIFNWIDQGILAMQNFGSVIASTFSIFRSLGQASEAAGGATLASLADSLRDVATAASSPAFQQGLTGTLSAAYGMMEKISTIAGPAVEDLIVNMASNFQSFAPTMGDTIGTAIEAIASALANPAVTKGMASMVTGFNDMVHALAPAMDPLAEKFDALGGIIGALAGNIGTVLAAAITTLTPIFASVAEAVTPVIEKLGPMMTGIVQDLAPVFEQIGSVITGKVAPALMKMVDAAQNLWNVIGPILVPVLKVIVTILGDALAGVITGVTMVFQGLTQVIQGLVGFFKGLWDVVAGLFSGDMSRVTEGLSSMWDGLKDIVLGAFTAAFGAVWAYLNGTVLGWLRGFGIKLLGPIAKPLGKVLEPVKKALTAAWTWLSGMWVKIVAIFKGGESGGGGLTAVFAAMGQKILAPFKATFTALWAFLKGAWTVVSTIFTAAFSLIWTVVRTSLTVITTIFKTFFSVLWVVIRTAWTVVSTIFTTAFTIIRTLVVNAWNGIKVFIDETIQSLLNTFRSLGSILDFFAMLWSQIVAGVRLMGTKVQEIWFNLTEYVLTRVAAWKALLAKAWNAILNKVKSVWNSISKSVSGAVKKVQKWISDAWAKIKQKTYNAYGDLLRIVIDTWSKINSGVSKAVNWVRSKVSGAWNWIQSKTSGTWNAIRGLISDAWWSIRNAVSGAMNNIRSRMSSGWNSVKSTLRSAWNSMKSTVRDAWNSVKTTVSNGIKNVISKVKGIKGKVKSALAGAGTILINTGEKIIQGLIDGIGNMFGDVKGKLQDLTGKLTSWKGPESRDKKLLTPVGELIIDGLIKGFDRKFGDVRASLSGLTTRIERDTPVGMAGRNIGLSMGQSIVTGLNDSRSDVLSGVTSLAEQIATTLRSALDKDLETTIKGRVDAESAVRGTALEERLAGLERNITRASRQRASESQATDQSSHTQIDNITISLEDLKQLKDLEEFLDMLRVRVRQEA